MSQSPGPPTAGLWTERLILRPWRPEDRPPMVALNLDPVVMEYFPAPYTEAETHELLDAFEDHVGDHGYGPWAVEIAPGEVDAGRFAGYIGLWPATFEAAFTPAVEIGWRLARWSWGRGYATEGAQAALADGFERLGLDEIVSFTTVTNQRSRRVMEKLGLHRDPADDFDHPRLDVDDPLRPHVLYRITADEWRAASRAEGDGGTHRS